VFRAAARTPAAAATPRLSRVFPTVLMFLSLQAEQKILVSFRVPVHKNYQLEKSFHNSNLISNIVHLRRSGTVVKYLQASRGERAGGGETQAR
jgi:hypothetical protein